MNLLKILTRNNLWQSYPLDVAQARGNKAAYLI